MLTERVGPIEHQPGAPLRAWGWLTHSEPAARARLLELARAHGWDPNAIAGVIAFESGGDPSARNPKSSATGLIQFMPETASAFGTTVDALRSMSALRQLDLVERYFASALAGKSVGEVGDYYMAVFMPKLVGAPDETEAGGKGSKVYDQNAGLDWDKSGILDAGDVKQTFRRFYAKSLPVSVIDLEAPAVGPPPHFPFGRAPSGRRGPLIALGLAGAAGALWWFRRRPV